MPLHIIIAEVFFMKKKDKKKKKIIDLSRFLSGTVTMDENGSYTGMPDEYYYEGIENEPVQDEDDL